MPNFPAIGSFPSDGQPIPARGTGTELTLGRLAAPRRVLQMLLEQGLTGRLQVSRLNPALPQGSISQGSIPQWSVYVAQGQVQFAEGADPRGDRLAYLLTRSCRQLLPSTKPERKAARNPYRYLEQCWKGDGPHPDPQDRLSLQELRSLLRLFSQEALVHVLAIAQGRVQFDRGVTPDPLLISLDLGELMEPLAGQIEQWQALYRQGIFPHGRLSLLRGSRFAEQFLGPLQALSRSHHPLDPAALLAGQPSLYRIAAQLNGDLLPVAQLMGQAVALGYLRWQNSSAPSPAPQRGTVACLDSSPLIQQQVREALEPAGYRVLGLGHPQQALSILVKEQPRLLLIDGALAVEEERGLGHLLRESVLLRHIPQLLLTPHDSLINPMRAKAAGAQGWVVKPLEAAALLRAVDRWAIAPSPRKAA